MALRGFTVNEMVHVTGELLDPGSKGRAALERAPLLERLVPLLVAAHRGVVSALPEEDGRAKALGAEAAAVDAVHDALVRKIYDGLTALAELGGPDTPYLALRNTLLPEGVSAATLITYEGEAGLARRVRERLTDAAKRELAAIRIGARTLLEIVGEWLDAGERLASLEAERKALVAAELPNGAAINNARLRWIQVVNALRALAPLAELSAADAEAIFKTLSEVEVKADARRGRRTGANIEASVAEELESDPTGPAALALAKEAAAGRGAATDELDTSKVRTDLPGGSPFTD